MKRILTMLLACYIPLSNAKPLLSFNEIYSSVSQGNNISLIIHFDKCNNAPSMANLSVYTAPTAIMLHSDYLQFANSPLTTNNPAFLKKPILENITYKILNTNNVELTIRLITLPNYLVANEFNVSCPLNTAVKVFNQL